jgi:prevent-host-death family protein
MEVSVAYARANLAKLLQSVAEGERVTILRHKEPVAELVPPAKRRERKFGTLAHLDILIDPHALDAMTDEEAERFIETGDY